MNYFTNERFKEKFKNNFDLVNFSIDIAKEKIKEEKKISLSYLLKELEKLPDIE